MDYILLGAPPDDEDPPAVQDLVDATDRARTLARETTEKMKLAWLRMSMLTDAQFNFRSGIRISFPHRTSACR
jgi:hypothetical protein